MQISFFINGRRRSVETAPLARLLDLIRDGLGLKGCKEGCGEGECGACSVIMDGRLVNACMVPAIQAAGSEILTIEGLGGESNLDALQRAFLDEGAVQCGFCTPGMILAARTLLESAPAPNPEDTKTALSGNLCRCTGYARIHAAVDRAAREGYRPVPSGKNTCRADAPEFRPVFSDREKDRFFRPAALPEALDILARHPDLTLLAGGTDIGPDRKNGKIKPTGAMDLFRLLELNLLERTESEIHIGACVTDTDMMECAFLREELPALHAAAARSAAPAIRNRASIGGNLCTASGAADLPVALMALGASVILRSRAGERSLPVEAFLKGYRKPDLRPGEILVEIRVPRPPKTSRQVFYKRGSRAALTLSRVSVALYVEMEQGRITRCRAAAGSMSPVPVRLSGLEASLSGKAPGPETIAEAVGAVRAELNPRRSPEFRRAIAGNLVRRFLESL